MKNFVMSKYDHSEKHTEKEESTSKWGKKRCSSGSTDIVNAMASAVALGEAAFRHSPKFVSSGISSDSEISEKLDLTVQKNKKYLANQEIKQVTQQSKGLPNLIIKLVMKRF